MLDFLKSKRIKKNYSYFLHSQKILLVRQNKSYPKIFWILFSKRKEHLCNFKIPYCSLSFLIYVPHCCNQSSAAAAISLPVSCPRKLLPKPFLYALLVNKLKPCSPFSNILVNALMSCSSSLFKSSAAAATLHKTAAADPWMQL